MSGDAAVLCLRQCVPRETTGTERQGGSYDHGDSPRTHVAVLRGFTWNRDDVPHLAASGAEALRRAAFRLQLVPRETACGTR